MGHQRVRIVVKPDGSVEVRPYRVKISKIAQDQVIWECEVGEATIDFKPKTGSPFVSRAFVAPEGGSVWSGGAAGEADRIYEYGVTVRVTGDRRNYSIDPEVQVEP